MESFDWLNLFLLCDEREKREERKTGAKKIKGERKDKEKEKRERWR